MYMAMCFSPILSKFVGLIYIKPQHLTTTTPHHPTISPSHHNNTTTPLHPTISTPQHLNMTT